MVYSLSWLVIIDPIDGEDHLREVQVVELEVLRKFSKERGGVPGNLEKRE